MKSPPASEPCMYSGSGARVGTSSSSAWAANGRSTFFDSSTTAWIWRGTSNLRTKASGDSLGKAPQRSHHSAPLPIRTEARCEVSTRLHRRQTEAARVSRIEPTDGRAVRRRGFGVRGLIGAPAHAAELQLLRHPGCRHAEDRPLDLVGRVHGRSLQESGRHRLTRIGRIRPCRLRVNSSGCGLSI